MSRKVLPTVFAIAALAVLLYAFVLRKASDTTESKIVVQDVASDSSAARTVLPSPSPELPVPTREAARSASPDRAEDCDDCPARLPELEAHPRPLSLDAENVQRIETIQQQVRRLVSRCSNVAAQRGQLQVRYLVRVAQHEARVVAPELVTNDLGLTFGDCVLDTLKAARWQTSVSDGDVPIADALTLDDLRQP